MANSYTLYNGNGSTTDFTVSFPYISQAHVTLEVSGASVPFTWFNTTIIRATTAPVTGASNVKVFFGNQPGLRKKWTVSTE